MDQEDFTQKLDTLVESVTSLRETTERSLALLEEATNKTIPDLTSEVDMLHLECEGIKVAELEREWDKSSKRKRKRAEENTRSERLEKRLRALEEQVQALAELFPSSKRKGKS